MASFFVSRVDTEVDKRLDQMKSADAARLRGQAAVANSRLAYEVYEQMLGSARWQALAAKGAKAQRLLWASTGVKDKAYPDTKYVIELGGSRHCQHHARGDAARDRATMARCMATRSAMVTRPPTS